MKVTINGITAEGESHKDVFQQLASLQEVFDNRVCGACGSEHVKFVVRTVDDNNFYEIQCTEIKCRAKLAFGQHKKNNSLFPKRKDDEGNWLPSSGWTKYVPVTKES